MLFLKQKTGHKAVPSKMRDLIHRFNFKTKPWAFLVALASFALIFVVNVKNANAEIFPDAINATVSPANPKLNQNATISASVKPDSLSKVNLGSLNTFTFYVKNLTTNQDVVSNKTGSGSSIANITFPVRSPGFQTGQNNLEVHIAYIIVGTGSVVTMDFKGNLSLSVSPADATGPASLQLSHTFVASESNSSAFKYNFTLNFNPGETGQNPTSYNFDCGNGSTGQVTNLTAATFTCTYKTKDAFTVKANAVGAGSSILASAQDTVTADESGSPVNNPQTKEGNVLLGFLNQLINAIVGLLQELLYLVFYYFIAPIIQAMLNIRTYTDVFAAVIYPGWEVVRNVCNILFIVALIAIGLGTLFRVESYQYKHLLVDLIIAALLVNFSLVIAQAVLGVADTVQSQFLPNNVEVIRSLARDLMAGWKTLTWDFAGTGYFSNTIQPLFALALSIGSFIVFAALAGFLVIRIVMLWVLLMLSPLAYAMRVLPSTKSYAAKWWGEFLKYAFFTPIIAFFLNMAAVINNQYNAAFNGSGSVLQKLIDDPSLVGNSSLAAFVFRVGSNVIILVFIVIAIKAAEEAGVFGADAVAKAAKGGLLAPFKTAGALTKWAGERSFEGVQNKLGMTLDPRIWKHDAEEYFKKQKQNRMLERESKKIKGVPFGAPRDMLENYWNAKGLKRVWKSRFGLNGFSKNIEKANEFDEKARMLDDEERKDLLEKIQLAENEQKYLDKISTGLAANKIVVKKEDGSDLDSGVSMIRQIQKKLDEKIKATAKQRANLAKQRASILASGGDTKGVDAEIAKLDNLSTEMTNDLAGINSQVTSGAVEIDISSPVTGDYSDEFKLQVFNKDANLSQTNAALSEKKDELKALNETLSKDRAIKKTHLKNEDGAYSSEDKLKNIAAFKKYKKLAEELERPEAYYARAARIQREDEESKKIAKIHEEAELNKLLRNAVALHDTPKAIAILKKLTRDRNLNEATEDWGHTTDYNGVKSFLDEVLHKKLGMEHEEMMEVVTEIGYEAEESKQYNAARLTQIDPKTGHLTWTDDLEPGLHAKIVHGEMSKSDPRRRYGELPRWNYVKEGVDKYGNRVTVGFEDFGKEALLDAAGNVEVVRNISSQGNTYAMKAVMRVENWEQQLKDKGKEMGKRPEDVNELIDAIKAAAGKGTGRAFGAKK